MSADYVEQFTIRRPPSAGPSPELNLILHGSAGQIFPVVLTASNTGFVQGQTIASCGPDISVSGAPESTPGVLTVANPTGATATLTYPDYCPGRSHWSPQNHRAHWLTDSFFEQWLHGARGGRSNASPCFYQSVPVNPEHKRLPDGHDSDGS